MLAIDENFWFTSVGTSTTEVHCRATGRVTVVSYLSAKLSEVGLRGRFKERYGILRGQAHITRRIGAVEIEVLG